MKTILAIFKNFLLWAHFPGGESPQKQKNGGKPIKFIVFSNGFETETSCELFFIIKFLKINFYSFLKVPKKFNLISFQFKTTSLNSTCSNKRGSVHCKQVALWNIFNFLCVKRNKINIINIQWNILWRKGICCWLSRKYLFILVPHFHTQVICKRLTWASSDWLINAHSGLAAVERCLV